MRKLSKDAWVMLSLLVILVLVAIVAGSSGKNRSARGFDPRRTSYSTAPAGLRGLYDTLNKLDYRVRRHVDDLTVQPEDGILFLISPDNPVSDDEMRALQGWVERGNTLVMVSSAESAVIELQKRPKVHRTAPVAPSFLTPDVGSFNVTGSDRVDDDELDLVEPLSSPSGFG